MQEQTNLTPEELENIKGQEGLSVDLWEFDKKSVKIEKVEVNLVPSNYTPLIEGTEEHRKQWTLKVSSEILTTLGEGEDKIEFRASELFNLVQDKEGKLTGFPKGEKSNLMQFVKGLKIGITEETSLKQLCDDLQGKEVLVKAYDKDKDGFKKTYLKFLY